MKTVSRNSALQHVTSRNGSDGLIAHIDTCNAQAAIAPPPDLTFEEQPILARFQLRRQMSKANRHALVGGARIAADRQLKTMAIAAEGVVKMAAAQWEGLVQLHGTRVTKEFASIFLEMQNEFMDEVCEATAVIENRAAAEAERIESNNHPEFVKERARQGNEDRFLKEIAAVEAIANRIGELLTTRLGQHTR